MPCNQYTKDELDLCNLNQNCIVLNGGCRTKASNLDTKLFNQKYEYPYCNSMSERGPILLQPKGYRGGLDTNFDTYFENVTMENYGSPEDHGYCEWVIDTNAETPVSIKIYRDLEVYEELFIKVVTLENSYEYDSRNLFSRKSSIIELNHEETNFISIKALKTSEKSRYRITVSLDPLEPEMDILVYLIPFSLILFISLMSLYLTIFYQVQKASRRPLEAVKNMKSGEFGSLDHKYSQVQCVI